MPDFEHVRLSYSRMNPVLGDSGFPMPQHHMTVQTECIVPEPGHFFWDHGWYGPDGVSGLDLSHPHHRAPPAAMALRNDLGSNISVLKTLNLRFRCFLAKVHELERRNNVLEKQLQQAVEQNGHQRALTRDACVQTSFNGAVQSRPGFIPIHNVNQSAFLRSPTLNPHFDNQRLLPPPTDSNSNLAISPTLSPSTNPTRTFSNINQGFTADSGTNGSPPPLPPPPPPPRFLPGNQWTFDTSPRFGTGRDSCLPRAGMLWPCPDGIGVQIDTITPEVRALYNVLGKVKREREEYRRRWEEELTARLELQDRLMELEEELQESEVCQDELTLRLKQLRAELVLFKGLVSNNLSDLETKIQEKAMTVDMDICRRIDITARLCDVAQQRNCQETIDIFPVATPPATLNLRVRKPSTLSFREGDELSVSESDGGGAREEESCGTSTSTNQINEQTNKMFHQLSEFDDDSDSLVWEETEETLLLWEDFSGNSQAAETLEEQHEESIEKVISDTETLFKTRERDYQDTINQIELDLATAKSDMNRHLHEYMEMCSMKRGLDVQMETCRRLMMSQGDRESPPRVSLMVNDVDTEEGETKNPALTPETDKNRSNYNLKTAAPPLSWRKA